MQELILAFLLFCFLMTAVMLFGYRRYVKPSRILDQFEPLRGDAAAAAVGGAGLDVPFPVRVLQQVGEKVPLSPDDVSVQEHYLIAAGYRSDKAVPILYGTKVLTAAVMLLVAALLIRPYMPSILILQILVILGAPVLGFFIPNFVLERLVNSRQERLRLGLPDALDLMVVCVEAGLGLDQAIMTVSRELAITHPDISDELALVNLEMRAGTRRADALRNLARRTGEDELRKLVAILIQTDRFGTSMGDALRTHSDFMRVRRRQQAEERAAKVGVKLVFPIFFFILPSMFIVAAGPGVLQVVKYLIPMMRSFH
jgi:tight adherence protein C